MKTLLLDIAAWDLVLDVDGNIAVATEPYSMAQDAAAAVLTFLGECYYDTTLGVPYWQAIFGQAPPVAYIKAQLTKQALKVPGVVAARVFITSFAGRVAKGQVQVTDRAGVITAANF